MKGKQLGSSRSGFRNVKEQSHAHIQLGFTVPRTDGLLLITLVRAGCSPPMANCATASGADVRLSALASIKARPRTERRRRQYRVDSRALKT